MFGAAGRSWNPAKESPAVIRKDPELMVSLAVSSLAGAVVAGMPPV
jgi:hypothetical protein